MEDEMSFSFRPQIATTALFEQQTESAWRIVPIRTCQAHPGGAG